MAEGLFRGDTQPEGEFQAWKRWFLLSIELSRQHCEEAGHIDVADSCSALLEYFAGGVLPFEVPVMKRLIEEINGLKGAN